MPGTYILDRSRDGQFYFNLHAANGEKILTSEMYTTKSSALHGIDSVKANSPVDAMYDRLVDRLGNHRFNLKAFNGKIIGTSESYSSLAARENGITSCKVHGPTATTVDRTGV